MRPQPSCKPSLIPLASKVTKNYGSHGSEPSTDAGLAFEDYLDACDFTVPCTFDFWRSGCVTTWTHSSGAKLRRDYILVNAPLVPFVQASSVCQDHDGLFDHEDHLPCRLDLQGWHLCNGKTRSCHWNYDSFIDPDKVLQFQNALASLPIPSWDVTVDGRCNILEKQLRDLGLQFFGSMQPTRSRPKLTQPTLDMIRFKRQCLDYGRTSGAILDPVFQDEFKQFDQLPNRLN